MSVGNSVAIRNARLDAFAAQVGASALLRIYNGSRPALGAAVPGGSTLLAQLTMNAAWPAASNGLLTANPISSQLSAAASGAASWYRIVKADGTTHCQDGSVSSVAAATGDLQLDDINVVQGGSVAVTAATFRDGNAT
jgi:hypothetical protein